MNRRQLLKLFPAIGSSLVLPVMAFAVHSPSINTSTVKQALSESLDAAKSLANGQKTSKIGILAIGGLGLGLDLFVNHPVAGLLRHSSVHEINNAVADLEMVLLVAGSSAAAANSNVPSVARMLHEQGIFTLDFTNWPFDLRDFKKIIMARNGDVPFGFGTGHGKNATEAAALIAISHPELGQGRLQQASAVLVVVKAPPATLMLQDSKNAMRSIRHELSHDSSIQWRTCYEAQRGNAITVSILAGGMQ